MRKKTTEEFVAEAAVVHEGKGYDYSNTVYEGNKRKIRAICPTHGEFIVTAGHHLNGAGCGECNSEKMSNLYSKGGDKFIKEAKEIHGDQYDYSLVKYVNNKTSVDVICLKHDVFPVTPSKHTNAKQGCPICGREKAAKARKKTHSAFVEELKGIQPDLEVLSTYIGTHENIVVRDVLGIDYLSTPVRLLSGRTPTVKTAIDKTQSFIVRSNIEHRGKYTYGNVKYENNSTPVTITCPIHGDFPQKPSKHLVGQGCKKCSAALTIWKGSDWDKKGKLSKSFRSYKVYMIELSKNGERCIKIGKTYITVKNRYRKKGSMPYDYKILKVVESSVDGVKISRLERHLHNMFAKKSHVPKIEFRGETECFDVAIKDELLSLDFDSILETL